MLGRVPSGLRLCVVMARGCLGGFGDLVRLYSSAKPLDGALEGLNRFIDSYERIAWICATLIG